MIEEQAIARAIAPYFQEGYTPQDAASAVMRLLRDATPSDAPSARTEVGGELGGDCLAQMATICALSGNLVGITTLEALRKCAVSHATPVTNSAEAVATKKTYIKPLRTIVEIDARYADQIRDLLNAHPRLPPDREIFNLAKSHADRIRWCLKNNSTTLTFAAEMTKNAKSIMETFDAFLALHEKGE